MLDRVDPLEERPLGVAGEDRNGVLDDDRPAVERGVDEMDGDARDFDPGGQRVADGVGSGECRQQRRVEVQHPAGKGGEHRGTGDAHVARQNDELWGNRRNRFRQDAVLLGPARIVATRRRRHEHRLAPLLHCPIQGSTWTIGEDQGYLGVQSPAGRRRVEGTQVAAGSRNANRDPMRHAGPPPCRLRQDSE